MSISTRDPAGKTKQGLEQLAGGSVGTLIAIELVGLGVPNVFAAILGGALAAGVAIGMSWLRDFRYDQGRGA